MKGMVGMGLERNLNKVEIAYFISEKYRGYVYTNKKYSKEHPTYLNIKIKKRLLQIQNSPITQKADLQFSSCQLFLFK